MRRSADAAALTTIALGTFLAVGATAVRIDGGGRSRVERTAVAVEVTAAPPAMEPCRTAFHLEAQPSDWAVVGSYDGSAWMTPKGLAVEVTRGFTLAADRDARVRGVVFGVAQAASDGSWSITHRAAPIPVGEIRQRVRRPVRPARLVIPGVGAAELERGWLVVEHVLDAPDVAGGTAWTYLHAPRHVLHALLGGGCPPTP